MTTRFQELFKDVAIYSLGDFVLKASNLLAIPIYSRIFAPDEYGLWNFIITAAGLFGGVLILGLDSSYQRYFFAAKSHEERQLITSTAMIFLAVWGLGVALLCLPATGFLSLSSFGTSAHGLLFLIGLLTAPLQILNLMCGQILRNQFRARLYTVLNLATSVCTIGFGVVGAVVLGWGLTGVLFGTFAANVAVLPLRLAVAWGMLRWTFSVSVLRDLLSFGVPLVPTTLAYWIFAGSDRFILGRLSTLDQLGLYAVASGATSALAFLNGALGQAWSPRAVRAYEEDPDLAPRFFGQMLTYILVGFGIVCVAVAAFAREILVVLTTSEFYPAWIAIGPLALGFVAYASIQVTAAGISITKKTQYFALFSWLAAIVNVVMNVALVPALGMIASAWATTTAYIFLTLAYLIISRRLWPVRYEPRRALPAVALIVGYTLATYLLPDLALIVAIPVKAAYVALFVGSLFLCGTLGGREWRAIATLLDRRRVGVGGLG